MKSLLEYIEERGRSRPEQVALMDDGQPVTYRELDRRSRGVAASLSRLGVGRGDRIAVWLPNGSHWLVYFLASARVGAITVAVNTRYRAHEVADVLKRSGARMLFYQPGFKGIAFDQILREIAPSALTALAHVVVVPQLAESSVHGITTATWLDARSLEVDPALGRGVASGNDQASAAARAAHAAEVADAVNAGNAGNAADVAAVDDTAPCLIFTTSGTTKAPKFVLHSLRTITPHALDVAAAIELDERKTTLLVLPLCGTFGFTQATACLVSGALLVLHPVSDAAGDLAALTRYRPTHMISSDMSWHRLLALAPTRDQVDSLQMCAYAVFTPGLNTVVEEAARFGVTLIGLYGSSEVHALFSFQRPLAIPPVPTPTGGGLPVTPAVRVRARDVESGQVLPHGEPGEIEIHSPNRFLGYYGDAEATAAAIDVDGYFRTGDSGYTMPDGQFAYLERIGDVLRLSGFLVSPAEIESVLLEDPQIEGCQVVGSEDDGKPVAVAFVIARSNPGVLQDKQPSFDEAAAITRCKMSMAAYKVPARIVPVAAFPMTDGPNSAKIQKSALRAMARQLFQSA